MKPNRLAALIFFLLSVLGAHSQYRCRTVNTDESTSDICYFITGQKSTEIQWLKSNPQWKYFRAFDHDGKEIYARHYGVRGGVSHVEAHYHSNGALASAHYTMQPDGGIQYTDITTFFSPDGQLDHEEDMSTGDDGEHHLSMPLKPGNQRLPANVSVNCPPVPNPVNLLLINHTSDVVRLSIKDKVNGGNTINKMVGPSDTCLIGNYMPAQPMDNPFMYYSIVVLNVARKGYEYKINALAAYKGSDHFAEILFRKTANRK